MSWDGTSLRVTLLSDRQRLAASTNDGWLLRTGRLIDQITLGSIADLRAVAAHVVLADVFAVAIVEAALADDVAALTARIA